MSNICIPYNQLIVITVIFIILIIYIILYYNQQNKKYKKKIFKIKKECNENKLENEDNNINKMIDLNIKRDNLVLKDKLYPPLNRYPLSDRINLFNNYTRDSYDTYHLVGNLTRKSDNF